MRDEEYLRAARIVAVLYHNAEYVVGIPRMRPEREKAMCVKAAFITYFAETYSGFNAITFAEYIEVVRMQMRKEAGIRV